MYVNATERMINAYLFPLPRLFGHVIHAAGKLRDIRTGIVFFARVMCIQAVVVLLHLKYGASMVVISMRWVRCPLSCY